MDDELLGVGFRIQISTCHDLAISMYNVISVFCIVLVAIHASIVPHRRDGVIKVEELEEKLGRTRVLATIFPSYSPLLLLPDAL